MIFGSGELRFWLQALAVAFVALAAWRWGGGPERVLAGILVWFKLADPVNHGIFGAWSDIATVDGGHIFIDAVGLVVAVVVALLANRFYPLWFAAFQLVAFGAHVVREIVQGISPLAYGVMFVGPSYCQLVVLALGIWVHRRRTARIGPYRAWRSFSPPLPVKMRSNWLE